MSEADMDTQRSCGAVEERAPKEERAEVLASEKHSDGPRALYTHHQYIAGFIMTGAFAHGAIFSLGITIRNRMKIMYWQEY
jgi:hypothetical protein